MDRRRFIVNSISGAAGVGLASMTAAAQGRVIGANERIRIGLIGCGSRGNYLLDQVLRVAQSENLEVAALCDVWKVSLDTASAIVAQHQQPKPRLFSRYLELLEMNDIDAVIIASPDFAHNQQLIEATRRRKDIFVEKPMVTQVGAGNEVVKLVQATKNIVQVGNQRRSDARHQAGARLIQSGILGKVSEIEAAWHDAAPRWARDFANVREEDVDWEQFLMHLPRERFRPERFRRWHFYKDFTAGPVALLGAHLIDVGIWFMDDLLPKSAVAHGGVYVWKDGREHADTIDCLLEYPKGFLLNYSTRLGNASTVPEVMFYGTHGTFDTKTWTARGDGGGPDRITEPVTVPEPPRVEGDPHLANWIQCLRSRETPNAPVDVGYAHSVASIMCLEAWTTGRRQVFDAAARTIRAG
jgi:predicted dehydrogenase